MQREKKKGPTNPKRRERLSSCLAEKNHLLKSEEFKEMKQSKS